MHIYFALLSFDCYKCQNKKEEGQKKKEKKPLAPNNHGVSTFLLSGNYRDVQIFNN